MTERSRTELGELADAAGEVVQEARDWDGTERGEEAWKHLAKILDAGGVPVPLAELADEANAMPPDAQPGAWQDLALRFARTVDGITGKRGSSAPVENAPR